MANQLTIITVCYNDPNAQKTCESIVNQTFQDFDWIVVDGGSEKVTLDVFEKYKKRITKFISEKDEGLYDAYNKGLKYAKTPWVHFLNSGDCFTNENILKQIFENKTYDCDLLYGDINFIKPNKSVTTIKFPNELKKYFFINENIGTPSTFIKRELFEKYGNFSTEYKITGDLERWIVFKKNNVKFEHIPIVVADFDTSGISSKDEYKGLHLKERHAIYDKHYTKEEYDEAINSYKPNLRFFERIFSIKNSANLEYKMVTILNFHIKIKRKELN